MLKTLSPSKKLHKSIERIYEVFFGMGIKRAKSEIKKVAFCTLPVYALERLSK